MKRMRMRMRVLYASPAYLLTSTLLSTAISHLPFFFPFSHNHTITIKFAAQNKKIIIAGGVVKNAVLLLLLLLSIFTRV